MPRGDDRRRGGERRDRRAPASVPDGERASVRVLHFGDAPDRIRPARPRSPSRPGRHPRGPRRQLLPLHGLSRDRPGRAPRRRRPHGTGAACLGRRRRLHRTPRRPAADGAAGRGAWHVHRRRADPAHAARRVPQIAPRPRAHGGHRHERGGGAARRGSRGHRTRDGRPLPAVGRHPEELRQHEVGAAVPAGRGQGRVAGRAGGGRRRGVSRPRRGRRRAGQDHVGAAASGGRRRGRPRPRGHRHPSRARRQPGPRGADQLRRRGRGVSRRRRGLHGHLRHRAPHGGEPRAAGGAGRLRPRRRDADRVPLRPGAVHVPRHPLAPPRHPRAPRARDQQGRGRLLRPQDPHLPRRDRDLRARRDARAPREVPRRPDGVVLDRHPLARPSGDRRGGGPARRDDPGDARRRPRPGRAVLDVPAFERGGERPGACGRRRGRTSSATTRREAASCSRTRRRCPSTARSATRWPRS